MRIKVIFKHIYLETAVQVNSWKAYQPIGERKEADNKGFALFFNANLHYCFLSTYCTSIQLITVFIPNLHNHVPNFHYL